MMTEGPRERSRRERLTVDEQKFTGRGKPCPGCGHPKSKHTRASRVRKYHTCGVLVVKALHPVSDRYPQGAEYMWCPCPLTQKGVEAAHQTAAMAVGR